MTGGPLRIMTTCRYREPRIRGGMTIHPVRYGRTVRKTTPNRIRSVAVQLVVSTGEAPTANLIAKAAKSMDAFDLVSKERVDTLGPACRSCRQSSGC